MKFKEILNEAAVNIRKAPLILAKEAAEDHVKYYKTALKDVDKFIKKHSSIIESVEIQKDYGGQKGFVMTIKFTDYLNSDASGKMGVWKIDAYHLDPNTVTYFLPI